MLRKERERHPDAIRRFYFLSIRYKPVCVTVYDCIAKY